MKHTGDKPFNCTKYAQEIFRIKRLEVPLEDPCKRETIQVHNLWQELFHIVRSKSSSWFIRGFSREKGKRHLNAPNGQFTWISQCKCYTRSCPEMLSPSQGKRGKPKIDVVRGLGRKLQKWSIFYKFGERGVCKILGKVMGVILNSKWHHFWTAPYCVRRTGFFSLCTIYQTQKLMEWSYITNIF